MCMHTHTHKFCYIYFTKVKSQPPAFLSSPKLLLVLASTEGAPDLAPYVAPVSTSPSLVLSSVMGIELEALWEFPSTDVSQPAF